MLLVLHPLDRYIRTVSSKILEISNHSCFRPTCSQSCVHYDARTAQLVCPSTAARSRSLRGASAGRDNSSILRNYLVSSCPCLQSCKMHMLICIISRYVFVNCHSAQAVDLLRHKCLHGVGVRGEESVQNLVGCFYL